MGDTSAPVDGQITETGPNEILDHKLFGLGIKNCHQVTDDDDQAERFSLTAVSEGNVQNSSVANVVHGGMNNTTNVTNNHIHLRVVRLKDVSDVMTVVYAKEAWTTNNIAKACGNAVDTDNSGVREDDIDTTDNTTDHQPFSGEHSLVWDSLLVDKRKTDQQLSQKSPSYGTARHVETPTEAVHDEDDVRLKAVVKQCQAPAITTVQQTSDADHQCARKGQNIPQSSKSQQTTLNQDDDVDIHSASTRTTPAAPDISSRVTAGSVDLRVMQPYLQEELSPIVENHEIRLASVEKQISDKYLDMDEKVRKQSLDLSVLELENVSDSGVKTVTETNIVKLIKLAEQHPEMVGDVSSFLDSKLMSHYESDIKRCCSVM